MSSFIYGLNVNKSFADIPNPNEALENLDLDIRDIDIIRGIADEGVTQEDIIRLSNLDVDARRDLSTIYSDLSESTLLTRFSPDVRLDITTDHIINNQIKAKSFKYNYVAYDQGNAILGADISTSRVSSWSTFETPATSSSPIFYGGDVEVIPTPGTSSSQMKVTGINFENAPITRRFAAEVPTHLLSFEVGGATKQVYAMKGIPIKFNGYFRSARLKSVVTQYPNIFPTWLITNTDNGIEYAPYEDVALSFNLSFTDSVARPRKVEFYYPPSNITELSLPKINIGEWIDVVLPSLASANVAFNDLREMPDFATLTPNLTSLNVRGNDMSRAVDLNGTQIVANTQLSTLPTTLTSLDISGSFSDSADIDISYLTNLQSFTFDSRYEDGRASRRRYMSSFGKTPRVNSSSITNYSVTWQRYRQLDTSVTSSTSIRSVNIVGNNITSDSDGNEIAFNNNNNNMLSFSSYSNSHNLVDLSGHDNLTSYSHRFSRGLVGSSTIEGIFTGCDSLERISLYATDATGDFDGSIANLGSLRSCDVRYTRIHGRVTASSFINTSSLVNIYFAGSYLGLDSGNPSTANQYTNTFENDALIGLPELRRLYCYRAGYVTGNLPDFTLNPRLYYLYVDNTGFTGGMTNFSTNRELRWLVARNSKFNQTVPTFSGPSLRGMYLNNNFFYGRLRSFDCANLYYLYLNSNNLGKDESGNIDSSIGRIPSFLSTPRLQILSLNNNFFTSYESGSVRNNLSLRYFSVANNQLSLSDAFTILSDLNDNWNLNNRSGVRIDLRGNPGVTEDAILNDSVAGEQLVFLRSRGWSIFI